MPEEMLSSRLFLPLPALLFCPLILDRAELGVNQRRTEKGGHTQELTTQGLVCTSQPS